MPNTKYKGYNMVELTFAFFTGLVVWQMLLLLAIVIGFGVALNFESSVGFGVLILILLTISWGGANPLWMALTFWDYIGYGFLYLAFGVAWSFFKWKIFVANTIDRYKDANHIKTKADIKRKIDEHKNYDNIGFWVVVWPLSLIGYFINDFIRDIVTKVIRQFYTVYDRITDSAVSKSNYLDDEPLVNPDDR